MRRKILLILIMMLALSILVGCSVHNNDTNESDNYGMNDDSVNSNRSDSNDSAHPSKIDNEIVPLPIKPVRYVDGYDFSDDVAWVLSENGAWHCIDKNGNILIVLDTGEEPISGFSHDVSLVKRFDETIELINKNGMVISSPKLGEYDKITSFIHELGMIIVYKYINTFQLTEDQNGIINSNGSWQQPLHKNPVLYALGQDIDRSSGNWGMYSYRYSTKKLSYINHKVNYIGNGLINVEYITWRSNGNDSQDVAVDALYNIYTGFTYDIQNESLYSFPWDNSNWTESWTKIKRIDNGFGVYTSYDKESGEKQGSGNRAPTLYKGSVFAVNESGVSIEIINNVYHRWNRYDGSGFYGWGDYYDCIYEYSDGLFYYSDKNNEGFRQGFFDIHGNIIIDLFAYNIVDRWQNLVFSEELCLLFLENDQGSLFFTVIDTKGSMLFDPKPADTILNLYEKRLKCGMFVYNDRQHGLWYVVNQYGEYLVQSNSINFIANYSEDVALVKTESEIYYIDKAGMRIF